MIDTEGFDELFEELDGFGTELQQTIDVTLQTIAQTLPSKLRGEIFATKNYQSGTLGRSISATYTGSSLVFGMVDYGYYQVFGVRGTDASRSVFGLSSDIAVAFTGKIPGDTFRFTKTKHPGISGVRGAVSLLDGISDLIIETIIEE